MSQSAGSYPQRIICLTEETTETLYLLGEQDRIVGVSGYTVRPPEARLKPRVSAFITANVEKIAALKPDIVFAFSDLQADIAARLIREGFNVFTFNQRSLADIFHMMLTVGRIVGNEAGARILIQSLETQIDAVRESASRFPFRPRVFFEEWGHPLISGIRWVEELVEVAGGIPIFPELRDSQAATGRIVDPADVVRRNPDVIIGSWCGRRIKKNLIRGRTGWGNIRAVETDDIYEVKSAYILQPGPAALTEGLLQLHGILAQVVKLEVVESLRPAEETAVPR